MLPLTDIIALILGIFLTTRKLDVAKREVADHGRVSPEDFARWKEAELQVFRVASSACFGKVAVGFVLFLLVGRIDWSAIRMLDLAAHVGWLGALVGSWVLLRRARALRQELGIVLVEAREEPAPDDAEGDRAASGRR